MKELVYAANRSAISSFQPNQPISKMAKTYEDVLAQTNMEITHIFQKYKVPSPYYPPSWPDDMTDELLTTINDFIFEMAYYFNLSFDDLKYTIIKNIVRECFQGADQMTQAYGFDKMRIVTFPIWSSSNVIKASQLYLEKMKKEEMKKAEKAREEEERMNRIISVKTFIARQNAIIQMKKEIRNNELTVNQENEKRQRLHEEIQQLKAQLEETQNNLIQIQANKHESDNQDNNETTYIISIIIALGAIIATILINQHFQFGSLN